MKNRRWESGDKYSEFAVTGVVMDVRVGVTGDNERKLFVGRVW